MRVGKRLAQNVYQFQEASVVVNLIWTAVVILVILWALGFAVNIGGGLIHLLLVLALIGLVYNLLTGRRVL